MQGDALIFWTLLAFLCGSIPFSLLVGFWLLEVDIRRYGDGNPGAANVIRVGGWRVGMLATLLDSFKGAAPVGAASYLAHRADRYRARRRTRVFALAAFSWGKGRCGDVWCLGRVVAGRSLDFTGHLSAVDVFHRCGEQLGGYPGNAGVAGRSGF